MSYSNRSNIQYLAIALSLMVLSWVIWDIWQRHFQSEPLVQTQQKINASPSTASLVMNIQKIIDAHIFGQAQKIQKPQPVKARATRLKLTLIGIFLSDNPNQSRAIIETQAGKQQVVMPGETIGKSGVTLSVVEKGHILIKHNNKLEKLSMKRKLIKQPNNSKDTDSDGSDSEGGLSFQT